MLPAIPIPSHCTEPPFGEVVLAPPACMDLPALFLGNIWVYAPPKSHQCCCCQVSGTEFLILPSSLHPHPS